MPDRNTLKRMQRQKKHSRAIFIVGAPRAGAALLFQLLRDADQIATLSLADRQQLEAVIADQRSYHSDRLDAAAATPAVVALLARLLRDQPGRVRLLDQNGVNALRIPFLSAAFPAAQFIYLYREPREQLAHMLAAWRSRQFVTYPQLPGWDGPWSLPLIPAWQTLRDKPLAEIALAQWAAITTQLLDDLAALDDQRWCALSYADLLADPHTALGWLGQFADLRWRSQPHAALAQARSAALAAPQHSAELAAMLPLLAELDQRAQSVYRARHPALHSRRAGPPPKPWPRSGRFISPSIARALTAGSLVAGLLATPAMRPSVARAASLVVTNLNDAGAGSLRQAIDTANSTAGADVITFQSSLSGTIGLTSGGIIISDTLDIQGPGPDTISVSGKHVSGVFYLYGSGSGDIAISGLTITAGSGPAGAGISNLNQKLTLDNVTISNNTASIGGGIFATGPAMDLTIRDSIISGNTAIHAGGGVLIGSNGGPLVIQNTTITGNGAAAYGGGIYLGSLDNDMTIENSTISDNAAGESGGGVYLDHSSAGTHTIRGTTISGNTARDGGGVYLYDVGSLFVIESSTISGNHATAGDGGGINSYTTYGDLTIRHSTVANNSASGIGGGMLAGRGATLSHVIVADNSAATNKDLATNTATLTATGILTTSFSLIESPGSATISNQGGNILSQDPQLGPLANNGGPTQTQLPAATSPVLNAGNPAFAPPPSADQRGRPRVAAGKIDLGAVERQPSVQLQLTQQATPDPVGVGLPLTYTIVVTNTGPGLATGIVMTDTLPLGVAFISANASQGTCTGTTMITCALGTLAAGAHATVTLVVRPTASGTIVNTAFFRSNQDDPSADTMISVSTSVRERLFLPIITAHAGP